MGKCSVCGKSDEVWNYKMKGTLYCPKHYHEIYRHGKIINFNGRRKVNEYIIKGDVIEFTTTNGEVAYIDKEDKFLIDKFYWGLNSQGYLHTRVNNKLVRMHHALVGHPINLVVDHINRDKKDNRKVNLRLCTHLNNSRNLSLNKNNKSGFRGVSKIDGSGKWRVRIMVKGQEIYLGRYRNFSDAKKARVAGELKYFKEYSPSVHKP